MKRLITMALAIFITQSIFAQDTIKVDDASKYVGKKVVVCAKVYGVKFLDRSKNQPTFINIGAAYPNSPMTILAVVGLSEARPTTCWETPIAAA